MINTPENRHECSLTRPTSKKEHRIPGLKNIALAVALTVKAMLGASGLACDASTYSSPPEIPANDAQTTGSDGNGSDYKKQPAARDAAAQDAGGSNIRCQNANYSISPAELDFGAPFLGTITDRVLTVTNLDSDCALHMQGVTITEDDELDEFSLTPAIEDLDILQNKPAELLIRLAFNDTEEDHGRLLIELGDESRDGGVAQATVELTSRITGTPILDVCAPVETEPAECFDPPMIRFADIEFGSDDSIYFVTLKNTGDGNRTLAILNAYIEGDPSDISHFIGSMESSEGPVIGPDYDNVPFPLSPFAGTGRYIRVQISFDGMTTSLLGPTHLIVVTETEVIRIPIRVENIHCPIDDCADRTCSCP